MFNKLRAQIFGKRNELNPEEGYDIWSLQYDNQPGNLMLALDEEIFSDLLRQVTIKNKYVIDIGCGTGRHWGEMLKNEPSSLIGYDVSLGMLEKLKRKYPGSITYKLSGNKLPEKENETVDLLISTLTLAHIEDIGDAFIEWNRVVKPGGHLIITDYHPETLARGGKRTFSSKGKTYNVKNYIHSVKEISVLCKQLHWQTIKFEERVIDDSVKKYYERKDALATFEKFKGSRIIYGILLQK
jgi:ubiquinone/menaquinone biosynthesis C-methylase UbiE